MFKHTLAHIDGLRANIHIMCIPYFIFLQILREFCMHKPCFDLAFVPPIKSKSMYSSSKEHFNALKTKENNSRKLYDKFFLEYLQLIFITFV